METYSNCFSDGKIRTREMIYEKYGNIYRLALDLEKETMKLLGDDHPITDEISLVCTHMMNGDIGIEDYLYSDVQGCNQLELETLKQVFQVLESIDWSGAKNREEIRSACNNAAKLTAKSLGIKRNTVADIWVRRLGLPKKTEGFLDLVEDWLTNGDDSGLKGILKSHTPYSMHQLIDGFFKKWGSVH
jgi:hypothetical protein